MGSFPTDLPAAPRPTYGAIAGPEPARGRTESHPGPSGPIRSQFGAGTRARTGADGVGKHTTAGIATAKATGRPEETGADQAILLPPE